MTLATDENGTVVYKADYDPFGNVTTTVNDVNIKLRFPGQVYDEETGLHYNGARYYDPQTGKFNRPDPRGLSDGMNPYLYAYANPVGYFDANGFSAQPAGSLPTFTPAPGGTGVVGGGSAAANEATFSASRAAGLAGRLLGTAVGAMWPNELGNGTMPLGSQEMRPQPEDEGECKKCQKIVYRVFAGEANLWGRYWTPVNPLTVPNYRQAAGLPNNNAALYLATGCLVDWTGVSINPAAPLDGNPGGLVEYFIPAPQAQVQLISVTSLDRPL